jgi:hypothetical protein
MDVCGLHKDKVAVLKPSRARKKGRMSYIDKVREYMKQFGLMTTEQVLGAVMMELDELSNSQKHAGTRRNLLRLANEVRKQIWVENGGGKDISDALIKLAGSMAKPDKPRPKRKGDT